MSLKKRLSKNHRSARRPLIKSAKRRTFGYGKIGSLLFERLEDRRMLAVFSVSNLNDNGAGSLRDAIIQANDEVTNPGADTITFDNSIAGGTINLSTIGDTSYGPNAFAITSEIIIDGTGETVARSGAAAPFRIFYVSPTGNLTLENVTISNGLARGGAGGIAALNNGGGGGGGGGLGGGIYNQGTLSIQSSSFTGNTAQGGAGGAASARAGSDEGGGGGGGGLGGNGGAGGQTSNFDGGGGGGGFFGNGGNVGGSGGGGGGGTINSGANSSGSSGGAGGTLNGGNGGDFGLNGANGGFGGGGGGGGDEGSGGAGGVGGGGGGAGEEDGATNRVGGAGGFGGGGGGGGEDGNGGGGGFAGGGGGGGAGGTGAAGGFGAGTGGSNDGGGGGGAGLGGAIFNDGGTVTIAATPFTSNSAQGGAGGSAGGTGTTTGNSGQGLGPALLTRNGTVTTDNPTGFLGVNDGGTAVIVVAVVVNGTSGDDVLIVNATTPDSGTYSLNGGPAVVFAGIVRFEFNGLGGGDLLRINNPVGTLFAPASGIFYNGGGQAGDSLENLGGSSNTGSYDVGPGVGDGVVRHTGAVTQVITFTGLAPVTDTVPEATFTVNGTDAANAITLDNGTTTGDGLARISIDAFEPISFANKTNVTINGGLTAADLGDTIDIQYTDLPTGLTSLTVNGLGGNDDINVTASPSTVSTSINGGAADDDIVVDGITLTEGLGVDGGPGTNTLTVDSTNISNNVFGNGLTATNFATVAITDSTFSGNANHGILLSNITSDVSLTRVTANDNNSDGGVIGDGLTAAAISGNLTVIDSTFSDTGGLGQQRTGVFVGSLGGVATFTSGAANGASGNALDGVRITGNGVSPATFTGGAYSSNGDDGIDLDQFGTVTLTNLTADNNAGAGGDGAELNALGQLIINGGSYSNNGTDGIDFFDVTGTASFTGVNASNNGEHGLIGRSGLGGTVTISGGTYNDNAFDGILLRTAPAVVALGGVVALRNGESGIQVTTAGSFSDTDGNYSNNDTHGIQLTDIAGNVTLVRTTANDNNGDGNGNGDGINAVDGGDADLFAIGGNLLIQGGSFSDTTDLLADPQQRGIFVSLIDGDVTLDVSGAVAIAASGNQLDGINITGDGTNAVTFTGVTANDNGAGLATGGDGIELNTVGAVAFTNVTAARNDPGVLIVGAASFFDTDGVYNNNDDHGIQLIDIAGNVTLIRTIANDNDADEDGVGDALNATDGADADLFAIGGDLLVQGGTFSDTADGPADPQQNGIFVSLIDGNVTLQSSGAQAMAVNGNQVDGVNITGDGVNSATLTSGSYSDNGDSGIELTNFVTVTVTDVTADRNITGLFVTGATTLSITDSNFRDNDNDGILAPAVTGNVTLTGVTASDNNADFGVVGNGFTATTIGGNLTVTNSTFSDTVAPARQRNGVAVGSIVGDVTFTNSTADGNAVDGVNLTGTGANAATFTGGSYSANGDDGIDLAAFATVELTGVNMDDNGDNGFEGSGLGDLDFDAVTAAGNETGVFVDGASSFSDTDGVYSNNDDHGIQLIDIAGNVTLVRTTANDNDADEDGIGDGLNATDGGDADNLAIGGDLLVQGGTFSNTADAAADPQENGIVVSRLGGALTLESSGAQEMSVTGNQGDGIDIRGVALSPATLTDGNYSNNGGNGIFLLDFTDVTLTDVTADNNFGDGAGIFDSESVTVTGGSFSNSGDGDGLDIFDVAGDATFTNVVATGNDDNGMFVTDVLGTTTITGSTADDNGRDGILLLNVNDVVISNTSASGNLDDGIELFDAAGVVQISFVTASDNGNRGFAIDNSIPQGRLELSDLTLEDNDSGFGGQINNVIDVVFTTTTIPVDQDDTVDLFVDADGHQFQHTRGADEQDPVLYDNIDTLEINTLAGEDTVNISATRPGTTTTVNTGDDNDVINVGSPGNTLDDIDGPLFIDGGAEDPGVRVETVSTSKGDVSAAVPTGDVLNIFDQNGPAGATYIVTDTTVSRDAIVINYTDIEEVNLFTGPSPAVVNVSTTAPDSATTITGTAGPDNVVVTDTAPGSILIINTNGGDDSVTILDTGNDSVTKVNAGTGTDTLTVINTGNASGLELNGDDDNDVFTISNVGTNSRNLLQGGAGSDTFDVFNTAVGSGTDIRGGASNDTINIGGPAPGSINGIQGQVCVFGDTNNSTPTVTESVTAKGVTTSVTMRVGDTLNINDQATATNESFTIYPTIVRRTGTADVRYFGVETLNVNGGTGDNTFAVRGTAANRTTINGNIGDDSVRVRNTATRSILLINTVAGDDFVELSRTGDRSVTRALTGAGMDDLVLLDSGRTSGVELDGGTDDDTFLVRNTGIGGRTLIEGQAGQDEILIAGTGRASLTDIFGGANTDTIEIGDGTLDPVRGTICVRGEAHDAGTRTVRSGAVADFPTCTFTETTVTRDTGDLLIFNDELDTGSDTFVVREPAPAGFPRYSFQRTGSALVQFDTVESIEIRTGGGDDTVLLDRIAMVAGSLPFFVNIIGAAGDDTLEVRGTAGDDRITVGSTTQSAVLAPVAPATTQSIIMVTGLECLDLVGNAGNDALVNNTSITSVLSGGFCNVAENNDKDVLIGGDATDVIYGGPDVDALFGRGGNDFLFADFDENGNVCVNGGEVIDGGIGGVDNAISLGVNDVVCNVEGRLIEEGAIKDVIAFLQAQLLRATGRGGRLTPAALQLLEDAEAVRCDLM